MTALTDQERRTRYTPVSATRYFPINFTLFDDDDVAVFHDGVEVEADGNWAVEATYTAGEATGARIATEDAAGWSDVTVDIVGRRRPRRDDQFNEGRGVPSADLNLAFNRLVAEAREAYDRTQRTMRVPPGETMDVLPALALRAGMVLGFDDDGQPIASDLVGADGWSPVYALANDSARRVLKLVGYVGGEGTAPTDNVGEYVGSSGYVAAIGDGVDVRGPAGASGAGTGDMLAANNLSDLEDASDARTNLGLGDSATKDTGTGSGDVAAGDHNHDTRYYTEAEVDAAIAAAVAAALTTSGALIATKRTSEAAAITPTIVSGSSASSGYSYSPTTAPTTSTVARAAESLSLAFTAADAGHKLRFKYRAVASFNQNVNATTAVNPNWEMSVGLFRDSGANAIAWERIRVDAWASQKVLADPHKLLDMEFEVDPTDTSEHTYSIVLFMRFEYGATWISCTLSRRILSVDEVVAS